MNHVVKNNALNKHMMQKINRLKMLEIIRRAPISRVSIAEKTGLSLATVTNVVSFLIEENLVIETGTEETEKIGRKAVVLEFNPSFYELVCVKLDTNKFTIALTDLGGVIKLSVTKDVITLSDPESVTVALKDALDVFFESIDHTKVLAVGIGVSGLVLDNEKLLLSTSLKWNSIDLKHEIQEHINKPVIIENITATNALFIYNKLKSEEEKNVIYIEMENGIGAAQIYNGDINNAVIGEIGHTTVERNGDLCFCGNKGCLEVMCSVDRMISLAAKDNLNPPTSIDDVFCAVKTDQRIRRTVDRCGEYLGFSIANIINIFNPQKIIINSIQYNNSDHIHSRIIKCVKQRVNKVLLENLTFERANISEEEKIAGIAKCLTNTVFDLIW